MTQYYYLIASLPDLKLDDYKEPYRAKDFVAELKEHLTPQHFSWVRDILCLQDNGVFADALMGRAKARTQPCGNWTFEELQKRLEDTETPFGMYFDECLTWYRRERAQRDVSPEELEDRIYTAYYGAMAGHENHFVRAYTAFDRQLRNMLVAINKRLMKLDSVTFITVSEEDDMVYKLLTSPAADFNLSGDIEYSSTLIEQVTTKDIVHSEHFIDRLRWDTIDAINTFSYFDIDVLLGYLIKLLLVERWLFLDAPVGKKVFEKRTEVSL